jgi:hypothetical protein
MTRFQGTKAAGKTLYKTNSPGKAVTRLPAFWEFYVITGARIH